MTQAVNISYEKKLTHSTRNLISFISEYDGPEEAMDRGHAGTVLERDVCPHFGRLDR
jgi:hypothetical protein